MGLWNYLRMNTLLTENNYHLDSSIIWIDSLCSYPDPVVIRTHTQFFQMYSINSEYDTMAFTDITPPKRNICSAAIYKLLFYCTQGCIEVRHRTCAYVWGFLRFRPLYIFVSLFYYITIIYC